MAVKLDRTVTDKARFVAARRNLTLAEYLTGVARATVERDFNKAVGEMRGSDQ